MEVSFVGRSGNWWLSLGELTDAAFEGKLEDFIETVMNAELSLR